MLWKTSECGRNLTTTNKELTSYIKKQFIGEIKALRSRSTYQTYNKDGILYRYLCFGFTSFNSNNILLRSLATTTIDISYFIYDPILVTDGVRKSKLPYGGCFSNSYSDSSPLNIKIDPPQLIRKLVIYTGKQMSIYLNYIFKKKTAIYEFLKCFIYVELQILNVTVIDENKVETICEENVTISNDIVNIYCLSPTQKKSANITIKPLTNFIYICEVEGFTGKFN